MTHQSYLSLRVWLGICCAMIFMMAIIGAITRLTESGLSITQWEPVRGAIPPLNDKDWQAAFDLYKASPQYKAIGQGMDLHDYQYIYFWEWLHRLWGRLIGLVFALPLLFFWIKKQIPDFLKAPLLLALGLGGLQGFIGWFMVQSGLVDGMVSVSPLRLALHLNMAFLLYALLFWQNLRLGNTPQHNPAITGFSMKRHCVIAFAFLGLTFFWGALTAGLDAGKIYNSFPLMGAHFWPEDGLANNPHWLNFFDNPAAVQFTHRWLGVLTALAIISLALRLYLKEITGPALLLAGAALFQISLGIGTLLSHVQLHIAVAHQAGAILLLSALLIAAKQIFQKREII